MNYKTIGSVYGDKSKEKYNIFLSCDNIFYHRFGVNCAKTILHFAPFLHIHFHVANHSGYKLEDKKITYTHETIELDENHPTTGRYFASMRLIRSQELFEDWQYVMIIDVDSLAVKPIPEAEYVDQTSKLSQLVRKGGRWNNSMICLGLGNEAREFKKNIKEEILKKDILNYDKWYDQVCMDNIRSNYNIQPIDLKWLNFSYKKDRSYFYSGKGKRKDNLIFEQITEQTLNKIKN
jgi:hypothetical protein